MHHSDHQICLDGDDWMLRTSSPAAPISIRERDIPAHVPGCVHTDLLRAGLIPDPLVGDNEKHVQWIGEADWTYRRTVTLTEAHLAAPALELVCDGLDTIATLHLNGIPIGAAANMHHPHRFDLKPAARPGNNELSITFRSPLSHIRSEVQRLGPRPINGDWDPYVFIRKSASNFGWDWAPKLATCGIWRPIRIEAHGGARIDSVRPLVCRTGERTWVVECGVDLDWSRDAVQPSAAQWSLTVSVEGQPQSATTSVEPGAPTVAVPLPFHDPKLWWPRGWGEQNLYRLRVTLNANDHTAAKQPTREIDHRAIRVGFREAALNTTADEQGTPFELTINGRRIFCQGANWIPEGPYPSQASPETLRARVQQAAAANMNMLRVWGGGYYESAEFYESCDELGILVWQDFMFACAMYPEEPPYPALIEAEARHQISRLSQHPSVILWCGGNECTWAHEAWGYAPGERPWKERLAGKSWGHAHYFERLPRILRELDPTRPYWPNSPWPGREGLGGNHTDHGDRHTWDLQLDGYATIVPRFVSEYGHQSPSNYATLLTALMPADLTLGSRLLEHHQRGTGGTLQHIDRSILEHFRAPRDFDEWHYLAQLMQARAVKIGLEWARINQPRCMGALVWQFNDCWPGMSWSLIDSQGLAKPALHAYRAVAAPHHLSIHRQDGEFHLFACNDTDDHWHCPVVLRRIRFDGDICETTELQIDVPPRGVQRVAAVASVVGDPFDPARELILAQCDEPGVARATHFYLKDRELHYPRPQLELDRSAPGRASLQCTAKTLMRDVVFNADRTKDGTWGGGTRLAGPVTLLPGDVLGEQAELPGEVPLQPDAIGTAALTRPPVIWCANWFGASEVPQP